MAEFVRWLLGLKQVPDWASDGSWGIQLHSLPQGLWAVGCFGLALAAVVGVWYLYRGETSTVRVGTRLVLAALRALVLTCVAFMLLELVLVITKRELIDSQLLVLVDTSDSMGLNDPYRDDEANRQLASKLGYENTAAMRKAQRLELAKRALAQVMDNLSDGREVSVYTFAHQAIEITGDAIQSAEPKGTETAIGDALTGALAEHRGQPVAGMLLVSDGQSNAGEDPRQVAEQAGKQGIPIVTVAVGTEEGPSNARLTAIEADPVVFVRDSAEVALLIEAHGMQGRTGIVTLEKRQDAGFSEVGREEVTFNDETAAKRVIFKLTPEVVGEIELRARIADFGPELTEADNSATHTMKVVR
ncbi:MAG TPA: vWA domain-containing protein, partial [Pirellulales bacterium]|nr:vWA domain-containing protein [Pirellulales bacterium]